MVVGSYPLSSQAPTHVEVELGCDNTNCPENQQFVAGYGSVFALSGNQLGYE